MKIHSDEAVAEVRAARKSLCDRFGDDPRRLLAHLRAEQRNYHGRIIKNLSQFDRQRPCLKRFDTVGISIWFSARKVLLPPHQEKFVGQKMKGGGYLSSDEVMREALRHALRSPLKKHKPGHFAALAA